MRRVNLMIGMSLMAALALVAAEQQEARATHAKKVAQLVTKADVAAMAQEQPNHMTLEGTTGSGPLWIQARAVVPMVEINASCRCMVIRAAKGEELATLREDKRESPIVEALATALVNVATKGNYADWREYLDKLTVNIPAK